MRFRARITWSRTSRLDTIERVSCVGPVTLSAAHVPVFIMTIGSASVVKLRRFPSAPPTLWGWRLFVYWGHDRLLTWTWLLLCGLFLWRDRVIARKLPECACCRPLMLSCFSRPTPALSRPFPITRNREKLNSNLSSPYFLGYKTTKQLQLHQSVVDTGTLRSRRRAPSSH
jgi:hypothetical protein